MYIILYIIIGGREYTRKNTAKQYIICNIYKKIKSYEMQNN